MKSLIVAREKEQEMLERLLMTILLSSIRRCLRWSSKIRWRGIAFEDVCFVHQDQIRTALGIGGVQAEIYPWKTSGEKDSPGAQIDMLIDRADRVVNLCEMKFTRDEFSIDKSYDSTLRTKIDALINATKNKKNIQPTLVTT